MSTLTGAPHIIVNSRFLVTVKLSLEGRLHSATTKNTSLDS